MAESKHPYDYERVTLEEMVAEVTQKVPEPQRDEAMQLHKSLEEQWEPRRKRYEMAGWLAKGLLYVFASVIAWSGILILILLIHSTSATLDRDQTDLVTDFVKDLLPFIATPLGIAMGFYFREFQSELN